MSRKSSVLDGPGMGYGPAQHQRQRGVPLSTVILAGVCVILALLLALSLAGRRQAAVTSAAAPATAVPSPSGTDIPPGGASDTVSTFIAAWSLPTAERANALASVTVDGVSKTVSEAAAAKLATSQPQGAAAYTRVNDRTIRADQALTSGSRLQLQLVFDQAAVYGWLVTSVQVG